MSKEYKLLPGTPIELWWKDAYSPTDDIWTTVQHVQHEIKTLNTSMKACGYMVAANKNYLCLAGMWDNVPKSQECGKLFYIPSSEIIKIRKL